MIITQVKLENGTTLSLGDKILVEFKPLINDEEAAEPVSKEIIVDSFRPYEDGSNDVWIVSNENEVFSDSNFVKQL